MVMDEGDGARPEDAFRRSTFRWAQATKIMVESAAALGPNTKVPVAALTDIEYARDALIRLYIPPVVKIPAASTEGKSPITALDVQDAVSGLAGRVASQQVEEVARKPHSHRGADLSTPIISKNGKMLWASVDCPTCPSKATQRCQKVNGEFMEKPHQARKDLVVEEAAPTI